MLEKTFLARQQICGAETLLSLSNILTSRLRESGHTCVFDDQHHIIDEVVGTDDVYLGVLVVSDGELPDGEVEAPGGRDHLPPLVEDGPGALPQAGALAVHLADRVGRLLQSHSVDHEDHVCRWWWVGCRE